VSTSNPAQPDDGGLRIGIGVIGFGWMGRVHTQAYQRLRHHYPATPARPRLVAVADEAPGRAEAARDQYGFERAVTDWRSLIDDPTVQAVSITAPNFAHREMGAAFARAGKHIWIEKPVGVAVDDARHVAEAVRSAGVASTVGFNYRNAPAVREARRLITEGGIGTVTHAAFRLLGDYAADPGGAFTWRYELRRAGNGVLGDLASHGVDLIRFLLGDITEVFSDSTIFVPQRRRPAGVTTGHARTDGGELADVENEDWSSSILRMRSGARVTLDVSRVATGHQNDYGFRIHGTRGVVEWDFRRMGELLAGTGEQSQDLGIRRTLVGPGSGDFGAFQPVSGNAMSYDDLKVIEAEAFMQSIAGSATGADIGDAVAAAETVDRLVRSSIAGTWIR
jgi:predicted dehydrogenase